MSIGIWQIVLVLVLVVLLFGRGKISDLMGDVAKGITSFRKGIAEGNAENAAEIKDKGDVIDNETGESVKEKEPSQE